MASLTYFICDMAEPVYIIMVHVIHELHVLNESMDVSFVSLYIIRSQYFHNVL